jgi:predicted TPR repeat methyltransferase
VSGRAQHDDAHWTTYLERQDGRPPRALCRQVIELAGPAAGRTAIDLGCGAGIETRALLEAGWRVHAVDGSPDTQRRVLATTEGVDRSLLTVADVRFAELRELPPADLIYAGYALPYAEPVDFGRIWSLVRSALRPGGWFAGNLFGDRDEWAGQPGETYLDEASAQALFDGMQIVQWQVEDGIGPAFSGPKHWHVFDVIARLPDGPAAVFD